MLLASPLLGLIKKKANPGRGTGSAWEWKDEHYVPKAGETKGILYQGPYKMKHEIITTVPLDEKWCVTSIGIEYVHTPELYSDSIMTIYGYVI